MFCELDEYECKARRACSGLENATRIFVGTTLIDRSTAAKQEFQLESCPRFLRVATENMRCHRGNQLDRILKPDKLPLLTSTLMNFNSKALILVKPIKDGPIAATSVHVGLATKNDHSPTIASSDSVAVCGPCESIDNQRMAL
jgi:hypothetical protein